MKKIIRKISEKRCFFDFALKIIANKIVHHPTPLRPKYLTDRGYVEENGFYFDPNVKDANRIWIEFENHYYRVYHGTYRVFITLESTQEWYEIYFLTIHSDNGRYDLASVF